MSNLNMLANENRCFTYYFFFFWIFFPSAEAMIMNLKGSTLKVASKYIDVNKTSKYFLLVEIWR